MRIFQTFVLPDDLVAKYKLSFAAANFSRNLISGGGFDKTYSLIPVNVRGDVKLRNEDGYEVVYSAWRKFPILNRLAIFKEQLFVFSKIHCNDSVWFYNLNIINALLFILLKLLKPSVRLNVIILDFTPANSWKEQNYWYLKLLNKADGVISLSNSALFKCKNMAILPGVVPNGAGKEPLIRVPNRKFLLSGVLFEEISQISKLLEVFSQLPQCQLHITGKTDNEKRIIEYASKYPNIVWHGAVPFKEYMALLHDCTFVLSTRDPESPENQCNFPSKIIESLLHNRIIVSTIDYKQLNGIKYLKCASQIQLMKDGIKDISLMPDNILKQYANQGNIVTEMFGTSVWNKVMDDIEMKI